MNEQAEPFAGFDDRVRDEIRRGMTLLAAIGPPCALVVESVRFRTLVGGSWREIVVDGDRNFAEGNPGP